MADAAPADRGGFRGGFGSRGGRGGDRGGDRGGRGGRGGIFYLVFTFFLFFHTFRSLVVWVEIHQPSAITVFSASIVFHWKTLSQGLK